MTYLDFDFDFLESRPTPHCGRLDRHDEHGTCPGVITIEGGALETHDCGERAHPAEIRRCCSRCEGTICNSCGPCRRIS